MGRRTVANVVVLRWWQMPCRAPCSCVALCTARSLGRANTLSKMITMMMTINMLLMILINNKGIKADYDDFDDKKIKMRMMTTIILIKMITLKAS